MVATNPPRALLFDVFGTVVDWRSSVTRALIAYSAAALSAPDASLPSTVRLRASTLTAEDWGTLAQQWRNSYKAFTQSHDAGKQFITVDEHHYESLRGLLRDWQLDGLWTDAQVRELSFVWHYLDPWPDSPTGLNMLNETFVTATLSNGNVALLTDMAEHANLRWTHIFSAEQFKAYKPSPLVYKGAAERLGLRTDECALVAAHLGDLKAARQCGYQTVYVEREQEEDWNAEEVKRAKEEGWVDMWVPLRRGGLVDVALRLQTTGTRAA